ncbi:hypothetical protein D3C73_1534020 [compost metagenome]
MEKRNGLSLNHSNGCGDGLDLESLRQLRESVHISGCKHQTATVAFNNALCCVEDGG